MFSRIMNWLDSRTGLKGLVHEALYERIPGGARWRYVWGSTLVFTFVMQMITGFTLWTAYSPSAQTAWESVYYIQYVMTGGWLVRGIHHFTAQLMVVLLAFHFLQVVIDGAYRAPREVNFWLGLVLLKLVLGLALTGYLLPWDQKGYWATKVATSIASITPWIGPYLERLAVGGTEYGHHTLTRFFALHAGLLPALLIGFLVLHVALMRKHGLKHKEPITRPDAYFWPDQVLKDAVACLAVLAFVLGLTYYAGAELTGPADPSREYSAARPEWYFLFLFQVLKLPAFSGENEVYGAIVLPAAIMGFLFLMPLLGQWKLGHRFNVAFVCTLMAGAAALTGMAVYSDATSPSYQKAVADAEHEAHRAVELAKELGIPPQGAASLTAADPLLQGPRIFAAKCASCHVHEEVPSPLNAEGKFVQTAPTLTAFGSEAWIRGLLDPKRVDEREYFGGTAHQGGDMSSFVANDLDVSQVPAVALALAIEAGLSKETAENAQQVAAGKAYIAESCTTCHSFHGAGETSAPDLTGYASVAWLKAFIENPAHERFYGENNDRMPAFGTSGDLSPAQIDLVSRWLNGDWVRSRP